MLGSGYIGHEERRDQGGVEAVGAITTRSWRYGRRRATSDGRPPSIYEPWHFRGPTSSTSGGAECLTGQITADQCCDQSH